MINFNKEQFYIVTGASSGLGEATALLLNELGASVVAIARNIERLENMKTKCKNPENMFIEVKDLTEDIEGLPKYIKELKEKYGKFSGMAYCAGVSDLVPLQSIDYVDVKRTFDINYYAPLFMIKGFVDRRNNIGKNSSIVCISSVSALCRDKGHIAYGSSKAALCAAVKSISKEIMQAGIRINCVLPSVVSTPMTSVGDYLESQMHLYPFGFGEPSDVSKMIAYLLSSEAKFISGQEYIIDSGGVL